MALTVGQDGLVVNTAKYLNGQPILAVNPDPNRFDGILLPFLAGDVSKQSEAGIVAGTIVEPETLMLESNMSESGVIFSDGMPGDFLAFNAGALVTIRLAEKTTNLIVALS